MKKEGFKAALEVIRRGEEKVDSIRINQSKLKGVRDKYVKTDNDKNEFETILKKKRSDYSQSPLLTAFKKALGEFIYLAEMRKCLESQKNANKLTDAESKMFEDYFLDSCNPNLAQRIHLEESITNIENGKCQSLDDQLQLVKTEFEDIISQYRESQKVKPYSVTGNLHKPAVANEQDLQKRAPHEVNGLVKGMYFAQTDTNTCPLVSTINALLQSNGETVQRVADTMKKVVVGKGPDGQQIMGWKFPMADPQNQSETFCVTVQDIEEEQAKLKGDELMKFNGMSEFERVACFALRKLAKMEGSEFTETDVPKQYGEIFSADNIARLFGCGKAKEVTRSELCNNKIEKFKFFKAAADALRSGKVCIANIRNNHFVAVTGVTIENGEPMYQYIESFNGYGIGVKSRAIEDCALLVIDPAQKQVTEAEANEAEGEAGTEEQKEVDYDELDRMFDEYNKSEADGSTTKTVNVNDSIDEDKANDSTTKTDDVIDDNNLDDYLKQFNSSGVQRKSSEENSKTIKTGVEKKVVAKNNTGTNKTDAVKFVDGLKLEDKKTLDNILDVILRKFDGYSKYNVKPKQRKAVKDGLSETWESFVRDKDQHADAIYKEYTQSGIGQNEKYGLLDPKKPDNAKVHAAQIKAVAKIFIRAVPREAFTDKIKEYLADWSKKELESLK